MDEKKDGAYLILKPCPIGGVPITPDDFNKLRELIERDKPKKPVDDDCPSCNLLLMGNYDFCPRCGQRLIWEDDENES